MKKQKVFIGFTDIASCIQDIQTGFENLGYGTISAIHENRNIFHKGICNYNFSQYKKRWFRGVRPRILQSYLQKRFDIVEKVKRKALRECDIFIFIWTTFYEDMHDIPELKKAGKKIVALFMGSDVRYHHSYEQEMQKYGIKSYYTPEMKSDPSQELVLKLGYLRTMEKHADLIYSIPQQSQLALRPYDNFYIPVNPEIIKENTTQRIKPLIVHAPSNRDVKGTSFLQESINKLKQEGLDFDFKIIENMPNNLAINEYEKADIIIGELLLPTGGKLDREALAAGKIVVSNIRRDYIDYIPDDCPIIPANTETIYDVLKKIIPDYEFRAKHALLSRPYVMKYHDVNLLCRDILQKLDKGNTAADYIPTFFRNEYIPEDNNIGTHNKWVNFVKDCKWYKLSVASGIRNNLDF